ncbi:hypothetical protein M422DRAFT_777568 [Sphaerobolus stellatus SS14]|nr:hypothetical protein M422DRAFT_777568 [Sphaerobolus stellatus SS14]
MVDLTKHLRRWLCRNPISTAIVPNSTPSTSECQNKLELESIPGALTVTALPEINDEDRFPSAQHVYLEENESHSNHCDLPIELIELILSFAESTALSKIAQANHTCHSLATNRLYRDIEMPSPGAASKCAKTLAENRQLAVLVRKLHVTDADTSVEPEYYDVLHKALCNMDNLTSLSLLLGGAHSNVLTGTKFKLQSFTTACHWDHDLVEWLETQETMTSALFCGKYHHEARLSLPALPNLQRVSASPLILAAVVPGRPIEEAELCLSQPWLLHPDVIATVMRILAFSSTSIHTLQFITHLSDTPELTLSAFGTVPVYLPCLKALAIHIVKGSVTEGMLHGMTSMFSSFTSLQSVMMLSKSRADALHDEALAGPIVKKWGSACSTLEIISFPDSIWARNPKLGWITLKELERILIERERELETKEKELAGERDLMREE